MTYVLVTLELLTLLLITDSPCTVTTWINHDGLTQYDFDVELLTYCSIGTIMLSLLLWNIINIPERLSDILDWCNASIRDGIMAALMDRLNWINYSANTRLSEAIWIKVSSFLWIPPVSVRDEYITLISSLSLPLYCLSKTAENEIFLLKKSCFF